MNLRDPRFRTTVFLLLLASNANLMGMALAKLDSGRGTNLTVFTASLAALVVALCLFVLLREVWKRAP
jgi:hypothetical protein